MQQTEKILHCLHVQTAGEVGTEVALEFLVQMSTVRIFKKILMSTDLNLEHTFKQSYYRPANELTVAINVCCAHRHWWHSLRDTLHEMANSLSK